MKVAMKKLMTLTLLSMRVEANDQHLHAVYHQRMEAVLMEEVSILKQKIGRVNTFKRVIVKRAIRVSLAMLGLDSSTRKLIDGEYFIWN